MRLRTFLAPLTATLGLAAGAGPAAAATDVFVNELHYDNAGTDAGEAVEVAAPRGTDLTGWRLVLYNASNGATYGTRTLSGTVGDSRVLETRFPVNGLQNGDPDGVALVDPADTVRQFLSYDGSFTAADGAAAGQTSTDIGVAETADTPAGQSLQLTGSGAQDTDCRWAVPRAESVGALNQGQTFDGASGAGTPPPLGDCGAAPTRAFEVQGAGNATPLAGEQVTLEGVVVGDFQGTGRLGAGARHRRGALRPDPAHQPAPCSAWATRSPSRARTAGSPRRSPTPASRSPRPSRPARSGSRSSRTTSSPRAAAGRPG